MFISPPRHLLLQNLTIPGSLFKLFLYDLLGIMVKSICDLIGYAYFLGFMFSFHVRPGNAQSIK